MVLELGSTFCKDRENHTLWCKKRIYFDREYIIIQVPKKQYYIGFHLETGVQFKDRVCSPRAAKVGTAVKIRFLWD